MSLMPFRLTCLTKMASTAFYSTLTKRTIAYKSAISLETLYPSSSLKLTTPSFVSTCYYFIHDET